jgi:alpha-L-rhamnosidase
VQVQTYDVTPYLTVGRNEIRVVVSDGWFRGKIGFSKDSDVYGGRVAALCQIEAVDADGGRAVCGTGPGWTSAIGRVVRADIIDGETHDLTVDSHALDWHGALEAAADAGVLCGTDAPPIRRTQVLRPRSVTRLPDGRHVVDLGQNVNGWVRMTDLGPKGTALTLTHGEALDAGGDVTVEHLRSMDFTNQRVLEPGQIDRVVSGGPGSVFEPRHSTKGFQFVRIEGHPGPLTADDISGVVVHTALRRTGSFRCSDGDLNRLHDIVDWSFRGNACDIPTDCPQRERAGWTGDWQLFAPTAAFLYDVAGFSAKWLRDLAADQRDDGCVRNFAPDMRRAASNAPFVEFIEGSAGWGDAAVYVPWMMWQQYGDERILADQWASMTAWVEYAARAARSNRHPKRVARSAAARPHEDFLWDSGFHWGEWLEPGHDGMEHFRNFAELDFAITATAYLARSAGVLAQAAAVLGRTDDAARYADLAESVRAAWQAEFITGEGLIDSTRQAEYVRGLAFDLVPAQHRQAVADRLAEMVREAGTHLGTGFLATPFLLPVLADNGHVDLAYELLFQRTEPSWLVMIDRGATTIWEVWNGLDEHGRPNESLNHYSKGAVISFLHSYLAGIRFDPTRPACERLTIAPMPGGGVTWAEAEHESPHGTVRSSWRIARGTLHLTVDIPPSTTATVRLPDGTETEIGPGQARFASFAVATELHPRWSSEHVVV